MSTEQPCENCGSTRPSRGGDDLYQRARPGSKALVSGHRYERLCATCVEDDVAETEGGPWVIPPPSRPPKKRGFRR